MKNEHSAAAVVFHNEKYLLLKYEMGHWGFVKGNIEEGETIQETILRELEEETNIKDVKIIQDFHEDYEYYYKFKGELIHKKVDCLLLESYSNSVELSFEHVDYKWVNFEDAIEKLTHSNTKNILKKANKFLKQVE
ncbi:MAG: NUDIX domain-containing protein [Candidatus Lokiarchaeota archaeon]|nr:NUDIX domain-containing protein [Candidatus Lokiarchaeota archaeon]MBD3202009.1 NUDIX domain-containing protein [Candidatus Lokiarchaeota archaeon]